MLAQRTRRVQLISTQLFCKTQTYSTKLPFKNWDAFLNEDVDLHECDESHDHSHENMHGAKPIFSAQELQTLKNEYETLPLKKRKQVIVAKKQIPVEPIVPITTAAIPQVEEKISKLPLSVQVRRDFHNMRVDRFLSQRFKAANGIIQRLLRTGKISLVRNKETQRIRDASFKLQVNDVVQVYYQLDKESSKQQDAQPTKKQAVLSAKQIEEIRNWILFKNKDVIVINKPAGIATQGGTGQKTHVDALLPVAFQFNEYPDEEPRLVHRIDKETSGCLVIARNRQAAQTMSNWLKFDSRSPSMLKKCYWAIVQGQPSKDKGRITMPIERIFSHGNDRMVARDSMRDGNDVKMSITEYQVLDNASDILSWIACYPLTGRHHQIRIHCAEALKCAIIGDDRYAPHHEACNDQVQGALGYANKKRIPLHLHARSIVLPYKQSGSAKQKSTPFITVEAPVPAHFTKVFETFDFSTKRLKRK